MSDNPPKTPFLPLLHRYTYPDLQLEVILDHFREDSREGLHAEMTVTTAAEPNPGLLYDDKVNLSSSRSKADASKAIGARLDDTVDVQGIVTQVCSISKRKWREGAPTIILADTTPRGATRYLLFPLIEQGAISLIYGDGGSAKSTLALAAAVSVATGQNLLGSGKLTQANVLYADWEDDAAAHNERLQAICKAAGIPVPRNVFYRRQEASLASAISTLRQECAVHSIGLFVCDSIGLAGGDEPEAATTKLQLFGAARTLGTSFLGIDHVSKTDSRKPSGSVYTRNIARLLWAVDKAQKPDDNRLTIALRNEKSNASRLHHPLAYHLDYTQDSNDNLISLAISAADYQAIPDFMGAQKLGDQLTAVFWAAKRPLTTEEIRSALSAQGLDYSESASRGELNRQVRFASDGATGGRGIKARWSLANHEPPPQEDGDTPF